MKRLFDLIARLRGPHGCPWDQAQKLGDILADTIEEAYELEWAGTHLSRAELLDEMGDLVFLVCFAIHVARETDEHFTLENIATHAYDKIYGRHPHVFGHETADTPEESIVHWERIKAGERADKKQSDDESALHGIAGNLPPLRRAEKVQERAASVGFDWDHVKDIVTKLREEVDELDDALATQDRDHIQNEVGDLFFSVVNISRYLKLDADGALNRSTSKFIRRFTAMEKLIHADGKHLPDMTLADMDQYWERVKRKGPA